LNLPLQYDINWLLGLPDFSRLSANCVGLCILHLWLVDCVVEQGLELLLLNHLLGLGNHFFETLRFEEVREVRMHTTALYLLS
jgi:hypothetical protein